MSKVERIDLRNYLRQSMSVVPLGVGWFLRDVWTGLRWWWRDHVPRFCRSHSPNLAKRDMRH